MSVMGFKKKNFRIQFIFGFFKQNSLRTTESVIVLRPNLTVSFLCQSLLTGNITFDPGI